MSKENEPPSSSSASSSSDTTTIRSIRRRFLPILTVASHVSAPFISTFMLIHMSSPVAANFGGSEYSNKMMLLGREYYQTPLGEWLFVWIPLGVHVTSSLLKRLLITYPTSNRPASTTSWTSLHALTGYTTTTFLTLHVLLHRLYPASASSPISSLSQDMSYDFVKFGLHTYPVRNILLYAAVVIPTFLHAGDGAFIMIRRWLPKLGAKLAKKDTWLGFFGSMNFRRAWATVECVTVMAGIWALWNEPMGMGMIPSWGKRFDAVFKESFVFRWW